MNPTEYVEFQRLIVPLSAALGLSIIVERILEFAKNFLEPLLSRHEGRQVPKISKVDEKIEEIEKIHTDSNVLRARLAKELDPSKRRKLKESLEELEGEEEWEERAPKSIILVEDATDPDDGRTTKTFILQLLGFAAGIILARATGLQLFNSFLIDGLTMPEWTDYLMTGLLIGGGSAPIHTLIRFVTKRKVTVKKEPPDAELEEKEPEEPREVKAPAIISTLSDTAAEEWVDIPYKGGVDREILENVHKRVIKVNGAWKETDPDMIIYHHTAMDSRSTFENVVRVIKNRKTKSGREKWLTGYNCVVLADGSIHPFCRWDRRGNHAAGYNSRSLGIAFNGNFEPDPKVPDSNPDGRYGALRPTEAQVKAGARVVTLWTFLYEIDLNFEQRILPHKGIAAKACPGSAFPYDEFRKWVDFYRRQWDKPSTIKERIEAYKLKPYLYVLKK